MKTNTTLRASASSAAENPVFGHVTSVTSQQDNWPAWLSNDLNKIESKVCGKSVLKRAERVCCSCSERLTKEFSFHAFPYFYFYCFYILKWSQKTTVANGNESMRKKWEPKHHDVLCSKHFQKKCFTDRTLLSIQFGLKYMSTGNRLRKISSSNLSNCQ